MSQSSVLRRMLAPALLTCALLSLQGYAAPTPTAGESPVRLSSNENAFGFSPKAELAMMKAIEHGSYYNRNDVEDLVRAIAEYENVSPDYVLTTPGSGPILMMAALAYGEPGKNVVTTQMGYTQLTRKFEAEGGEVRYATMGENFGYDLEAMKELIDEDTAIVYLCNPNNPTGTLIDPQALRLFIMSIPRDVLVFVDEAYLEISDGDFKKMTMAPLVKLRRNVLISRTFSKGFGLAGHRIGYGVGHPDILEKLSHYYMGAPTYVSAIGARIALQDEEWLERNKKMYQEGRAFMQSTFASLGLEFVPSQGAFVYFRSGMHFEDLRQRLLDEYGIAITTNRASGVEEGAFEDWSRVSIGTMQQNKAFAEALSEILSSEPAVN